MTASSTLLVEDDEDFSAALAALLRSCGHGVHVARGARDALAAVQQRTFDVALVDLGLPDGDGIHLMEDLASADPLLPVVCLTGRSDPAQVVKAMRCGAVDYLTKPVPRSVLVPTLESAVALSRTRRSVAPSTPAAPVGQAPAWMAAMRLVAASAAAARTTVLFLGEPGVGKEVAVTHFHALSSRAHLPLVTANAACFSHGMVDSELFGHEAGAFTGAHKRRRGLFEQADRGTLFLDEIGELPLDAQGKLLRVLERHPFRRVGGEEPVSCDVRLVAATNRDLAALVREGRFRADLHERIRVFEVVLPPLRQRPGDVALLAWHFAARLSEPGRPAPTIHPEALARLEAWHWPGNVRELRNAMERALVLAGGAEISLRHLPDHVVAGTRDARDGAPPVPAANGGGGNPPVDSRLHAHTRAHIESVFLESGRNVTHAAARLGVSRVTLRKKLQAWGLRPVKT